MKKGFTLIELLAVIVMLSILVLLVFPKITDIVRNKQTDVDETMDTMIYSAINLYVSNNSSQFEKTEGYGYCVSINELVSKGYLQSPVKLYNSNEDITDTKGVQVKYRNGFNYELKNMDECTNYIPYKDNSGANAPELMDSLVPVIYNEDHWEIADITKEWYDYDNQEWANAVILSDAGKSKTLEDTLDLEKDVLAMFVWIPRYEYKIDGTYGKNGTSTSPGEIEINFIAKDTIESTEGYTVHPTFTFDKKQLSGIWVGKFETSHIASGTQSLTCIDEACADADSLRILPNVVSLRSNPVSKFFYASRSMTRKGNAFKLDSTKTDSHMMKNSEWGAVSYLTQSKYGKYGNDDYTGTEKEVYINNSIDKYTGRSGGNVGGSTPINGTYKDQSSTTTYNANGYYTYDGYLLEYNANNKTEIREITKGTGASTTGNIYGIYDMSGGAYEYVMGYLTTAYGNRPWGSTSSKDYAKFASQPDSKYFDAYTDIDEDNVAYTGHALGEIDGWYGDFAYFVSTNDSWFRRGGFYSEMVSAGVFSFYYGNGDSYSSTSFRVVFAPTT